MVHREAKLKQRYSCLLTVAPIQRVALASCALSVPSVLSKLPAVMRWTRDVAVPVLVLVPDPKSAA